MRISDLAWTLTLAILAAPRARTQTHGTFVTHESGCPGVTSNTGAVLYGVLPAGAWHLDGANFRFTHAGGQWSMEDGGAFLQPSPSATVVQSGDDLVSGPFSLGFAFAYPGGAGSTTAIEINSNGRVYLEPGTNGWNGGWWAAQILPDFLNATPSICPLGVDLNPGAGGLLTFDTQSVGGRDVALVTWEFVPEYGTGGANTFQCQLWDDDEAVVCIVETNGSSSNQDALVGVSAGGGATDPGASPLTTPVVLSLEGIPDIGSTFSIEAHRLPVTTTTGQLAIGTTTPPAPIDLGFLGAPPTCELLIDQIISSLPMTLDGSDGRTVLDLDFQPGNVGLVFQCQGLFIDPGQGAALPILVSNRGTMTIGEPPDLLFVIEGENSFYGSPETGGFFRLESSPGASHLDIVHLKFSLVGQPHWFDIEGNAGLDGQGYFDDGDGTTPDSENAYYGSDLATGLVYGTPGQPTSCDGTGTVGFVPSAAVGTSTTRFRRLEFEFAPGQFTAGESFGFDCDTDGSDDVYAGAHAVRVTVTFSDQSTIAKRALFVSTTRAERVVIP